MKGSQITEAFAGLPSYVLDAGHLYDQRDRAVPPGLINCRAAPGLNLLSRCPGALALLTGLARIAWGVRAVPGTRSARCCIAKITLLVR